MTPHSMTSDECTRRAAVTSTLRFAARHPSLGLGYEFQSDVRAAFATRRQLVAALHDLWLDTVCRRLDQLVRDPRRAQLTSAQLARIAWADTAAGNRCVRRLASRTFGRVFPVSAACVA